MNMKEIERLKNEFGDKIKNLKIEVAEKGKLIEGCMETIKQLKEYIINYDNS